MPKLVENEEYLNTKEAMEVLEASRQLFYSNAKPHLKVYHFNAKKTPWYKKRDVIALRDGKPVRKAHIPIGGIFEDWTQHLASLGYQASTELDALEVGVSLPDEANELLGISSDMKFVKRSRRSLANGEPICTWSTFYPQHLVNDVIDKMKQDASFNVVAYIKDKHNITAKWSVEETTARMVSLDELNRFRLPVDESALILVRVTYTSNKEIVWVTSMVLLASWFTIRRESSVDIWENKAS